MIVQNNLQYQELKHKINQQTRTKYTLRTQTYNYMIKE